MSVLYRVQFSSRLFGQYCNTARRHFLKTFGLYFTLAFLLGSCDDRGFAWNPMEMGGWTFFWSYIVLNVVLFFVAATWQETIRESDRRESTVPPALTLYETAYLTDDSKSTNTRIFHTAITQLFVQGDIELLPPKRGGLAKGVRKLKLCKPLGHFKDPIEHLIAKAIAEKQGLVSDIQSVVNIEATPLVKPFGDRFREVNLFLDPQIAQKMHNWPPFCFTLSGLFGLVRVFIDIDRGQSVWLQAGVCVFVFLLAWVSGSDSGTMTKYGDRILKELIAERQQLNTKELPTSELPLSVALLGPEILKESALSELAIYFEAPDD